MKSSDGGGVRGRPFASGNAGRKPGTKNKSTVIAAALLQDEQTELLRKAIDRAKAEDSQTLRFLLSRLLPRERLITIDLPEMNFADDAVEVYGQITRAVCEGKITPSEGANLASLVNYYIRAIDDADIVKRLDALEVKVRGLTAS